MARRGPRVPRCEECETPILEPGACGGMCGFCFEQTTGDRLTQPIKAMSPSPEANRHKVQMLRAGEVKYAGGYRSIR